MPPLTTLHGGVCTRTVVLAPGGLLIGRELQVPTTLTLVGHAVVVRRDGSRTEVVGVEVILAKPGEIRAILALGSTVAQCVFHTEAETVEEAIEEIVSYPVAAGFTVTGDA